MSIKLIACDMDGTLLDSQKRLPRDILPAIRSLREQGTLFAIASGRQYAALRRDMEELVPEILFICENGGLAMRNDQRILLDPMDPKTLPEIIRAARGIDGVYPILCRADVAIIEESADPDFRRETLRYYPSQKTVADLMDYADSTDVCKVALFDATGDAQGHELPFLQNALSPFGLSVILSGQQWVDIMKPGTHKGTGMRALQKLLGITPDECMAFGDYLNDCELLESVTESYCMENGHPTLKAMAKYIAPSNDEDGVMRVLRGRFSL